MSDSTTILDQLNFAQLEKEVVANELFDAASPPMAFGRHGSACVALTWGYYGGVFIIGGTPQSLPNGTVALTDDTTNYVYLDLIAAADSPPGTIVVATDSIPASWPGVSSNYVALYEVITASGAVTSYLDWRTAQGIGIPGTDGQNWAVSVNAQTGTTYTLQASDNGKVVTLSNGSAITLTVPSGLGANFACELIQIGAGQVTVAASGVVINSYAGLLKLAGQHAAANLVAYAADVFNFSGNIAA